MLQTTAIGSFSAKSSRSSHLSVKQFYSGEREYLRPLEVEELTSNHFSLKMDKVELSNPIFK
ncbi:MAG: hypothetical protein ACRC80_08455 [Waterburya sp.]